MRARSAFGAALALAATSCGNLARDVIVEKGNRIEADGGAEPNDAGSAFGGARADAGSYWQEGNSGSTWHCDRDAGCRKRVEDNCTKYHCEDWCQYMCSYVTSDECRAKVHCRQSSARQGLP